MSDEMSGAFDLSKLRAVARQAAGGTVAERKEKERRALSPTDGRRRHPGVRTVQMNLRVTPEFKERLYELAGDYKCSMTEVVERGVALLVQSDSKT